jgi:hypothetical protein
LPLGGCVLLTALPSTPTRRSLNPPRGSHKQALARRYTQRRKHFSGYVKQQILAPMIQVR